ncbi:MAG: ORF6N domain-containing protein [Candidatus Marinimicrobia bacterium]|jgi:hypothetical protein|nr:ORF6N domain-containing protein [Candidatus Neomarinimicrobiota bacterium]MBT4155666.1 ORF6N domain-containing protein [Candidatus Neomarinimicrobiota bacterium]
MKKEIIKSELIPIEMIANRIRYIRNQKVILDFDIAEFYQVETRSLKQAVRRNIDRFPQDFMFVLTNVEMNSLRSQFVTLKRGQHTKYPSMAFTEQGVAMLSSVVKSKKAIDINISIIRAFIRIRELVNSDKVLAIKIKKVEEKLKVQGKSLLQVITIINEILNETKKPKKKIGF